jgi:amidase
MRELTSATATGLAELIAGRQVSAREVVDAHLRRIEEVNGALNAVVQVDAERALARAGEVDAALARGERPGSLHGVPFTVKDNIAAAGIPMAIGVPERAGVVPATDATAVGRLNAAGGILLGKTNCPPWGGGLETDNAVYGRTNNPYALTRTPAEAVAARRRSSRHGARRVGSAPIRARACACRRISAVSRRSSRAPVASR